ncbi:ribonuclease H-like protein [Lentinus tigrinus ALCF2SS1-7]|uniref:Ribonuclease H-like protein n=1 Tax=Lentinus tigrinus ALCF2SS1-6 TaxID=1328759 RepID=A0A5C2RTC1_9APHY|nr:ribonuclease H-like protein [Lentinus tigrinus ALCF2SS1-6]RPD68690.1 ribonuclease H-like protein [Lentinus tigrinus ALCF2SS1-7]
MEQKTLDWAAGPLVWIDCEMTGLIPRKDRLLEIAVLITDGNLKVVDEGVSYIIRTEREVLEGMDEWCRTTHGASGLTQACIESPHTKDFVAREVLNYIKKWVPKEKTAVLAGNSVHMDRAFLVEEMPEIVNWLHYRIVDVSSIKELARRWYSTATPSSPQREIAHRALDDIRGSIRELQWYRKNLFMPPSLAPTVEMGRRY